MLNQYLPVLIFLLLGLVIGGIFTIGNRFVGPRRGKGWSAATQAQEDPYECGLPSEVQKGFRFGVSFYLIAMLFILFDVEVLFIYPIAAQLAEVGVAALLKIVLFVGLLFVGFVQAWRRGALDWKV